VWGLGAAGPRVVTYAVIRDTYEGDAMAKAMSLLMALFVLVPIVAPSIGAAVVSAVSWRWLFVGCMGATAGVSLWTRRLPETLNAEHRLDLRFGRVARAAKLVVSDRQALGYTLAQTFLYGAFMSWIGSAESIISDTFGQEDRFPIIFGSMGAVIGIAMLVNSRIVHRFTARRVVHAALLVYLGAAAVMVATAAATDGEPPLPLFLAVLITLVACHALLIPNCTSIAMSPMAAVAGTAASIMGATLIAGGAILGSFVDGAYDGTMQPLALGFLGYGLVGFLFVVWCERGRLFRRIDVLDDDVALVVVEAF
jgi:DHA1 family bicyclomycin/chloramphenicol resistance-like MFS transporter